MKYIECVCQDSGGGVSDHALLTNVLPNQHHPEDHAARHQQGGADEMTPYSLPSTGLGAGQLMETDGLGGWTMIPTPAGGGASVAFHTISISGELEAGSGVLALPITRPQTIKAVRAYMDTPGAGGDTIFNLDISTNAAYTTLPNRPIIAAGANDSGNTVPDLVSLVAGDVLRLVVDSVPPTPGSNAVLTVEVEIP